MTFTIEPLGALHDRTTFACGVAAIELYFRELVTQDTRRRVSNCFVALDLAGLTYGG